MQKAIDNVARLEKDREQLTKASRQRLADAGRDAGGLVESADRFRDRVLEIILRGGGRIVSVNPVKLSLEDYFMSRVSGTAEKMRRGRNIDIRLETNVERINDTSVVLQSKGTVEEVKDVDMVVLCLGAASDNRLADELKWEGKLSEIHTIGDCNLPRKMTEAIYEGYVTALHI